MLINQNLNMLLNFNNDDGVQGGNMTRMNNYHSLNNAIGPSTNELNMLLFNTPCKIFYAVNNSEWSDGIDLNLMN